MERIKRTVAQSRTEQIQLLMQQDINGYHRLFGGRLLEWIDIVAGAVAKRHAHTEVTTVAIDHLEFVAPAHINDMLVLVGQVTYVGKTSMEVRVDTYIEGLDGLRNLINRAYLVLVAIDQDERPMVVPDLIPETEEEKREYEEGRERNARRKAEKQRRAVPGYGSVKDDAER